MFAAFVAFIAAVFGVVALGELAVALNYRNWRTELVKREDQLGPNAAKWASGLRWTSERPGPTQLDGQLRRGGWLFFAVGTCSCLYLLVQIAIGNAAGKSTTEESC